MAFQLGEDNDTGMTEMNLKLALNNCSMFFLPFMIQRL